MILILAHENDHSANAFSGYLAANRIAHRIVFDVRDLVVTVSVDRQFEPSVDIAVKGVDQRITAVLNRYGWTHAEHASPTVRFVASERLASLWAALGLFDGRVINRPTSRGFFADIHPTAFPRRAWSTAGGIYSQPGPRETQAPQAARVVHRLFSGEVTSWEARNELLQETGFDPTRTRFAMRCGENWIDLSAPENSSRLNQELEATSDYLASPSALFSMIVYEERAGDRALLAANAFPPWYYYAHCADLVHASLARFLSRGAQ